jgi:hypothetical protein
VAQQPDAVEIEVAAGAEPFWVVLGQSASDGWSARVDGATVGPRTLVDGYANGWLVTPDGPGRVDVELRWRPQRLVWGGLALSGVAVAGCLALLLVGRRRERPPVLEARPAVGWPGARAGAPGVAAVTVAAVLVAAGATAVASVPVALAAAALTLVAGSVPRGRRLLPVAAVAALVLSRPLERPMLAWLAVALLAADLLLARDDVSEPRSE